MNSTRTSNRWLMNDEEIFFANSYLPLSSTTSDRRRTYPRETRGLKTSNAFSFSCIYSFSSPENICPQIDQADQRMFASSAENYFKTFPFSPTRRSPGGRTGKQEQQQQQQQQQICPTLTTRCHPTLMNSRSNFFFSSVVSATDGEKKFRRTLSAKVLFKGNLILRVQALSSFCSYVNWWSIRSCTRPCSRKQPRKKRMLFRPLRRRQPLSHSKEEKKHELTNVSQLEKTSHEKDEKREKW